MDCMLFKFVLTNRLRMRVPLEFPLQFREFVRNAHVKGKIVCAKYHPNEITDAVVFCLEGC